MMSTVKWPRVCRSAVLTVCFWIVLSAHAEIESLIDLGNTNSDVLVTGASTGDNSGYRITSGDVNGDGSSDLILLSYGADPLGGARKGEIDVIWGSSFPGEGNILLSQSSSVFSRIFGGVTDAFNSRVDGGDFNGDQRFDMIWGQPYAPNLWGDGIAYVILGASSFPDTLDIGAIPPNVIKLVGGPWGGGLGVESCGCDLDDDGYDEIIVSAPWGNVAEIFVIWGGASFLGTYDFSGTPAGVSRITDSVPNTGAGTSLACADFDQDGFEDLVIGSPGLGQVATVQLTLLYGAAALPTLMTLPDPAVRMARVSHGGPVGSEVAVGDINGDGQIDLAVADAVADPFGCHDCGEAYVLLHPEDLPPSSSLANASALRVFGTGNNTRYGSHLEMGDLTGDSRDELMIVGFGDYTSSSSIDETVIVYGSHTPLDTILIANDTGLSRIRAPSHGVNLGRGLSIGDFNDDTIGDLVLGAHKFQGNTGRSYVFFGCLAPTDVDSDAKSYTGLRQNYPNPFNPNTTISYEIDSDGWVNLTVYDVEGRSIRTLVRGHRPAGKHMSRWDGRNAAGLEVASGVYFCTLQAGVRRTTVKMVLVR